MKVIKIPYNKALPATTEEVSEEHCLDEIKQLIGIEWTEVVVIHIKCTDPRRDYCLIVDEVGKLKEGWEENINVRASQFYAGALCGDPIVGNVVLCAREWTDSFGECDLTGLTDYEEEVLMFYLL